MRVGGILLVTGSIGLMGAMATDGLAVIGRHIVAPFTGSIELVQACIAIGAASAMAYATLSKTHAAVDLVFDRMPAWAQGMAHRLAALLGFLFIGSLIAGSSWILLEYWNAGERTEILGIEVRWLRLFWLGCAAIGAIAILAPVVLPSARGDKGGVGRG